MSLWLAVDIDNKALGVERAESAEQAYYQFMKYALYPAHVIKLPDSGMLCTDNYESENEMIRDGYYFSDRD